MLWRLLNPASWTDMREGHAFCVNLTQEGKAGRRFYVKNALAPLMLK